MTRFHTVYSKDESGEQVAATYPFSQAEEDAADAAEALASVVTPAMVNAERDRRVATGFEFGGKVYDSRAEDQKRIAGAAQLAFMAIVAGAQPGDVMWHGGTAPFGWIAQDNSLTAMDAQTVVAFGKAAAAWEQSHIFAGRALKDTDPVPAGFADNAWWPE